MHRKRTLLFSPSVILNLLTVALSLVTFGKSKAQAIDWIELDQTALQLISEKVEDEEKIRLNRLLKEQLQKGISAAKAPKTIPANVENVSVLSPEDSSFQLFNWVIAWKNGSYSYECALKHYGKKANHSFQFLRQVMAEDEEAEEMTVFNRSEWLGGFYYELIEKKTKLQTYYTLLAWVGKDRLVTKKYIDVLWFTSAGEIRFGAPIFQKEKQRKNRIVFRFGAEHAMALSYEIEKDRIEFDALMPRRSDLEGMYEFYFPDISFSKNAYQWDEEKEVWVFQEAVNLRTAKPSEERAIEREKEKLIKPKKSLYTPDSNP